MKLNENAVAEELPLNDEGAPEKKKLGRYVSTALRNLHKQLDALAAKSASLNREIEAVGKAITALDQD